MSDDKYLETRSPIGYRVQIPGTNRAERFDLVPGKINRVPRVIWDHLLGMKDSAGVSPLKRHLEAGWVREVSPDHAQAKHDGLEPIVPPLPVTPLQAAAEVYAETKAQVASTDPEVVAQTEARARELAIEAAKATPRNPLPDGPKRKRKHGVAGDAEDFLPLESGIDHGED